MHSTGAHCVVQLINVLYPLEFGFAWMPLHDRDGLNNGRVTGEETSQLPKTLRPIKDRHITLHNVSVHYVKCVFMGHAVWFHFCHRPCSR